MPELPDIELYLSALRRRVLHQPLTKLRLASPFFLRSVAVSPSELEGRKVVGLRRMGKRLVFAFEGDVFAIVHLMIAGRLRWLAPGAPIPGRLGLAAFDFPEGSLIVTEAGARKRASLHLVAGDIAVDALDPGGLEVLEATFEEFAEAMRRENHTVKRALTDPHLLSGIGNAFSDEILHAARLSPMALTHALTDEQMRALYDASVAVLRDWSTRLQEETGDRFPEKVTPFRPGMAVHGRHGKPCPRCGAPVQRIVYASNEANYCAPCQTGGRLLADRALSRLLRGDWPKTLEELEQRKKTAPEGRRR